MPSRRALLAAGAAGIAALSGCASVPAGPTDGLTYARTVRMQVPTVPPPAHPTDAQTLALRAFLDRIVTAAEPLFARASPEELGERNYRDCAVGVASVREWLDESAANPASTDVGFATSRLPYAGYALGFLRSWHGRTTLDSAFGRVVDARDALADAAASMPRRCDDPAAFLARVGWAERHLYLADIAVDQYADADPPEADAEGRRDELVGRLYRQAAKAEWFTLQGLYYARAYREDRPSAVTDFTGALRSTRRALLERAGEHAPPEGETERRAGDHDADAVVAYVRRAENPADHGREQYRLAERHADADRLALAAVAAGRARCHYAGYRRVFEAFDPADLRDGVDPTALFEAKRSVVERVRAALDSDDPLLAWLAGEPARLLFAGEVYLDSDALESEARRRAVCLSFYRHASGYADELPPVVGRLESGS